MRRLTELDVRVALGRAGLRCESGELAVDSVYYAPSRVWVETELPLVQRRFLDAIQRAGFRGPADCDDWTRATALAAQTTVQGLAVGEYFYHTRRGTLHGVNVLLVAVGEGAGLEVLFWEPQTRKAAQLDANEVGNGCIAWRM
jgi:hypothetical protein